MTAQLLLRSLSCCFEALTSYLNMDAIFHEKVSSGFHFCLAYYMALYIDGNIDKCSWVWPVSLFVDGWLLAKFRLETVGRLLIAEKLIGSYQ